MAKKKKKISKSKAPKKAVKKASRSSSRSGKGSKSSKTVKKAVKPVNKSKKASSGSSRRSDPSPKQKATTTRKEAPKVSTSKPASKKVKYDSSKPVSGINLEKARKQTIQEEKSKIYSKRYRLKKKLEKAKTQEEKDAIRNESLRTSRWLQKANESLSLDIANKDVNKILKKLGRKSIDLKRDKGKLDELLFDLNKLSGKKKAKVKKEIEALEALLQGMNKKAGFDEQNFRPEPGVLVSNVYVWNIVSFIDGLIDSGKYKKFYLNGDSFSRRNVMGLHAELSQLNDQAPFNNQYYYTVREDGNANTVEVDGPF